MSPSEAHSFERVLAAIVTNEHVASSLSRYADRDQAIEQLEADVARQRRALIQELRTLARANSASSVAARMNRDAALLGSRDV